MENKRYKILKNLLIKSKEIINSLSKEEKTNGKERNEAQDGFIGL